MIHKKEIKTNIKFLGYYRVKIRDNIQSRAIKEMIRIKDTSQSEKKHTQKKFKEKANFVDIDSRNTFQEKSITISIIKCLYRFNYYSLKNAMIKEYIIRTECLRCSEVKI